MSAEGNLVQSVTAADLRSMLRQFRAEATLAALPALYVSSFILLFGANWGFRDLFRAPLAALLLCFLVAATWTVHRWNHAASAWTLVVGCVAANLLIAGWGGIAEAAPLLMFPAGLAALCIGFPAGMAIATACSAILLAAPAPLLPAGAALRATALFAVWGAVGLVWLTSRPLQSTLEWSWSSYEEGRRLLEQARDYRMQLKQSVQDLADANLQLTRLNRVADGLRCAAEEARHAKEQFVANVSHELRTPLNMIIGFSEMIVRAPDVYGSKVPPALLADLAVILRNSQHLSSLIDDVLDLSQIEAGKMALTKERVVLREVVDAAATAVRPLFESKGLYLNTDVARDLPLVLCDRTRLREVVLNLLSNAGRFTERGGATVRVSRDGDDVLFSVTDTGPGIAREDAGRIFQPFQQLYGSIPRRYGGSGLGLAISKSFVELHGGKMRLESRVGSGTTFSFTLPIEPTEPAESDISRWFNPLWRYEERTRPSRAPVPVVCPRFVVLERGDILERLLTRYLDGYDIVAVETLEQAMAELARVPAQALLVNDASVSESLRQLGGSTTLPDGTPAIICSLPSPHDAAGALGVSGYLVKPVSREALLAALERLQLGGRTVLIVDDEPEAIRLFRRMLASSDPGYRVLRARDGREALGILRQQRVDAMLLDLAMPEMDGFRVLEARSQDPALRGIPTVVISARDPGGQPIVTSAVAALCGAGLSVPQLLACIQTLSGILSSTGQAPDPGPPERLYG